MKYPVTTEAKDAARRLVEGWKTGLVSQRIQVNIGHTMGENRSIVGREITVTVSEGVARDFEFPEYPSLWELAHFSLIDVTVRPQQHSANWELLLLQELRNAVESDFEVSEYFLTMNAVGTIVQGNLTLHPGAIMQSAAANVGNIQQGVEQLADDLVAQLGQEFLLSNAELRQAIVNLRTVTEANKQSGIGKVIMELGRCLGHTANTATIAATLVKLAQFL
jgi:hypothetical protein